MRGHRARLQQLRQAVAAEPEEEAVSALSAAAGGGHAPGLAPAGPHDRDVPAPARQLAARLSALFERDVEIVERLNDAQHRLQDANERLWSGLAPDAFGAHLRRRHGRGDRHEPGRRADPRRRSRCQQRDARGSPARPRDDSPRVLPLPVPRGGAASSRSRSANSPSSSQTRSARLVSAQQAQQANVHELARVAAERHRAVSRYRASVVQGTLRAYYFQLRLSVEDYEFPHFNPGRDANALARQVLVEDTKIGNSYLRHSPTPYNFELASFTERLRALQRKGSSATPTRSPATSSAPTISLSDGTGTLAGFVANNAGARLGFGPIDIDHSFLADALALSDDITETFPIRGDITADRATPPRGVNSRPALPR